MPTRSIYVLATCCNLVDICFRYRTRNILTMLTLSAGHDEQDAGEPEGRGAGVQCCEVPVRGEDVPRHDLDN